MVYNLFDQSPIFGYLGFKYFYILYFSSITNILVAICVHLYLFRMYFPEVKLKIKIKNIYIF